MTNKRHRLVALSCIEWTSHIEMWTIRQIKKNMWRFDNVHEFDDVLQDAKLLFHNLRRKYPLVDEPAHLFALYRTSLARSFVDKARKRRDSVIGQPVDDVMEEALPQSTMINGAYLGRLVDELPSELKTVLKVLTTGRVRLKVDRRTKKLRPRENRTFKALKHKYAISLVDPIGELKAYLSNA